MKKYIVFTLITAFLSMLFVATTPRLSISFDSSNLLESFGPAGPMSPLNPMNPLNEINPGSPWYWQHESDSNESGKNEQGRKNSGQMIQSDQCLTRGKPCIDIDIHTFIAIMGILSFIVFVFLFILFFFVLDWNDHLFPQG